MAFLLLMALTLAVFWQVQGFEFVRFDDDIYVTENLHVRSGVTREAFFWAFSTTYGNFWHPLTWLSHMLDCELFGLQAGGHHLTNLMLHLANTALLLAVLWKMTRAFWRSLFVAFLFALHPLHVESVAWVSERKDVLSTLFWLLTMAAYARYVGRPGVARYVALLSFFALGLMAKPMLVTLPCVLLLMDYWPLGRLKWPRPGLTAARSAEVQWPFGRLVWEKIPLFLLAAVASTISIVAQHQGGAAQPLESLPVAIRLANAVVSYVKYMGKLVWPSNLAVYYPYPTTFPVWQVFTAGVILVGITGICVKAVRSHPYLLVGWLWYLGTLVPVVGLIQVGSHAMADRYTYVPLIGLFILIAWGAPALAVPWGRGRVILGILAGIVLLALVAGTWRQARHWETSISLFTHTLGVTTNNWLVHNHMGMVLKGQGRLEEARGHFLEALKIHPYYAAAHNNLGSTLEKQGRLDEALGHYTTALQINPMVAETQNNLGNVAARQGRFDEALAYYLKALQIKPDYPEAHSNLGLLLVDMERFDEAVDHYRRALQIRPLDAEIHTGLADALVSQGRIDEAMEQYFKALQINPGLAGAHNNLGMALARQGQLEKAAAHYTQALRINPDQAETHNNLANVLIRQGRLDEAVSQYREAIRIKPEYAKAHYNLGNVLVTKGRFREAVVHYERALQAYSGYEEARRNLKIALELAARNEGQSGGAVAP